MGGITSTAAARTYDAVVVGLGPAGAATLHMLREPERFGIAGRPLNVLGLEARGPAASRQNVIMLRGGAIEAIEDAGLASKVLSGGRDPVAPIGRIETAFRASATHAGADLRYHQRIDFPRNAATGDGVRVQFVDGSSVDARFLVDASGGRLGPFRMGAPTAHTTYATANLNSMATRSAFIVEPDAGIRTGDGVWHSVPWFGFNDATDGATMFLEYPQPLRGSSGSDARRVLTRQLARSSMDTATMRDARFITVPSARSSDVVRGSMLAVGNSVRQLSPRTGAGVSNALMDSWDAATAIQRVVAGDGDRAAALQEFTGAVTSR